MKFKSLENNEKVIGIFNILCDVISKYEIFLKCSGIASNAAETKVGHEAVLVGLCKEKKAWFVYFSTALSTRRFSVEKLYQDSVKQWKML